MSKVLNLKAAEHNIMQAIYAYTANRATPLTPENCQGELTLNESGDKLRFETSDLTNALAPLVFAKLSIQDFGSHIHLSEPYDDGEVANITLKFRYSLFGAGTNGHDFANVRLGLDGEVIEMTFAEEEHREFVKDNPRFA